MIGCVSVTSWLPPRRAVLLSACLPALLLSGMCLTPALGFPALSISLADLLGSGDRGRARGRARARARAHACLALLKSSRLCLRILLQKCPPSAFKRSRTEAPPLMRDQRGCKSIRCVGRVERRGRAAVLARPSLSCTCRDPPDSTLLFLPSLSAALVACWADDSGTEETVSCLRLPPNR